MIFFLVMPGLFGGFGNYFVVIFQGSPEVVYPRVNNFSILILSLSYLFLILSLISEFGGGTGWTFLVVRRFVEMEKMENNNKKGNNNVSSVPSFIGWYK